MIVEEGRAPDAWDTAPVGPTNPCSATPTEALHHGVPYHAEVTSELDILTWRQQVGGALLVRGQQVREARAADSALYWRHNLPGAPADIYRRPREADAGAGQGPVGGEDHGGRIGRREDEPPATRNNVVLAMVSRGLFFFSYDHYMYTK